MKLEIGKNQGYIILDDDTGKIMSVFVQNIVDDKFDFKTFTSFKVEDNKHYNMRTDTMIASMDPQLEKDIMRGKLKFKTK